MEHRNLPMTKIILFNKPFNVLCQFTDAEGRATLGDYLNTSECRNCYPAGRLDRDSEGLLLLTDTGQLQQQISHPRFKLPKTYWVEVEGEPSVQALESLRRGIALKDGMTRPAQVTLMAPPKLWPRNPPVRFRANIPTTWLSITITEGRNRQVRRMTAAVGLPTLRLVRAQIGPWQLNELTVGAYRVETVHLNAEKPAPGRAVGAPVNRHRTHNPGKYSR